MLALPSTLIRHNKQEGQQQTKKTRSNSLPNVLMNLLKRQKNLAVKEKLKKHKVLCDFVTSCVKSVPIWKRLTKKVNHEKKKWLRRWKFVMFVAPFWLRETLSNVLMNTSWENNTWDMPALESILNRDRLV